MHQTGIMPTRAIPVKGTSKMLRIRKEDGQEVCQQICVICGTAFINNDRAYCAYDDDQELGLVCPHCADLKPADIPARLREGGKRLAMLAQELIQDAEHRVALADRIESGQKPLFHEPLTLYVGK